MNLLDVDPEKIYKYGSQGEKDYGWGCVYRNVQTIRALKDLDVPSIAEMQSTIGIDPNGKGRELWIEPIDTKRYFPWETKLVLYQNTPDVANRLLRTRMEDFESIMKDSTSMDNFFHDCFKKNRRVLLDDSRASYVLTGIVDDTYIYIDPHVQTNNVRSMTHKEFYNRPLWMAMC